MLSVIIPVFNEADRASRAVENWLESGIVGEVIIADGGSLDGTPDFARAAGAQVIKTPRGRGRQMAAGAGAAVGDWLLFVHADTCLGRGWQVITQNFIVNPANQFRAGYFRFSIDDASAAARRLERIVAWRCRVFGLPYGDQGLLISAEFYHRLGGFPMIPLMEDVELVRQIAKHRLEALPIDALTSNERYLQEGYLLRPARNLLCLALYYLGVSPTVLEPLYEGRTR